MKKLVSYTLPEVVISIVLVSLVFLIAVFLLLRTNLYFQRIESDLVKLTDIQILHAGLMHDFQQSNTVHFVDSVLSFNDQQIQYLLGEQYIVKRFNTKSDTFFLSHGSTSYDFLGQTDLVAYFNLSVKSGERMVPFVFSKEYPARVLIENFGVRKNN